MTDKTKNPKPIAAKTPPPEEPPEKKLTKAEQAAQQAAQTQTKNNGEHLKYQLAQRVKGAKNG